MFGFDYLGFLNYLVFCYFLFGAFALLRISSRHAGSGFRFCICS